ncbi:MAG: OmpH family outer membrane protein [Chlorobi bacterium]|nr:OmpH family outer membrane protein [Chlorobiota bacterium]
MKRLLIAGIIFLAGHMVSAQKYVFVDSEYILKNIPAYEAANEQLTQLSKVWQKEIEDLYKEVSMLYEAYQTESVFLSNEMKKKRENEIIEKEKNAKELQKKYFGPQGELFKKRESLIKPIQDEIYTAISELAAEKSYAAVFDKSSGLGVMYSDPKYDISDVVLERLGIKKE